MGLDMESIIGERVDHVTRIYCPECGHYEMGLGEGHPASLSAIAITCKRCKTGPYKAVNGNSIYEKGGIKVRLEAVGEQMVKLSIYCFVKAAGTSWYGLLWSKLLPVFLGSDSQPAMHIGVLCRSIVRATVKGYSTDYHVAVNEDCIFAIVKGHAPTEIDDFGEEYCKLEKAANNDDDLFISGTLYYKGEIINNG